MNRRQKKIPAQSARISLQIRTPEKNKAVDLSVTGFTIPWGYWFQKIHNKNS
jgi:hypothetical protein